MIDKVVFKMKYDISVVLMLVVFLVDGVLFECRFNRILMVNLSNSDVLV